MEKSYRSRGFTLIELLVVIAIIGILSAVVLASLNTARSRGNDAAIQSNLSTVRVQAEIYYSGTGVNTYGTTQTVCTAGMFSADTTIARAITATEAANGAGNMVCNSTATAYAISSPLSSVSTNSWCIDSSSQGKQITGALGSGVTLCP